MMLRFLNNPKKVFFFILIHILIGILSTYNNVILIVWVYLILLIYGYQIIKHTKNGPIRIISLITYLAPFELMARMAQTSPYIPYEFGRYLIIILSIIGFVIVPKKDLTGIILLLLLLPSTFFDNSYTVVFRDLLFNLLGPVSLCLLILFLKNTVLQRENFFNILKLLSFSLVAILSFTIFKNPDFEEFEFTLTSQAATTGGFGANQVSTILGFGVLLFTIYWINNWKVMLLRIVDLFFLIIFLIQGFLTFSRGGLWGGILSVLVLFWYVLKINNFDRVRLKIPNLRLYFIPAILVVIGTFIYVNNFTGGALLHRYKGETRGTLEGSKELNATTITTGRIDIFMGDIDLWMEDVLFGVGVGASRYLRTTSEYAAHIELSRLLAEHGLFGLAFFLILLGLGLKNIYRNKDPIIRAIIASLFVLALFTTFHAAMRTFITPLLIGLTCINIQNKVSLIKKE